MTDGETRVAALAALTLAGALLPSLACNGVDRRSGAATAWTRSQELYFHQGVAAGAALLTDGTGAVFEERRYEPFGGTIDAFRTTGGAGAVDFTRDPRNVLNKETDPSTQWSFHGARWMSPQTARWLSPDPAVKRPDPRLMLEPWDLNPYSYVRQNPQRYWDPDGALAAEVTPPMEGSSLNQVRLVAQQGDTRASVAALLHVRTDHVFPSGPDGILDRTKLMPGDEVTVLAPPAHLRVLMQSLKNLGSTEWAASADGKTWHCNQSVSCTLRGAGLKAPAWRAGQFGTATNENPNLPTMPWVMKLGQPGGVAAWKLETKHASGHVLTLVGSNIAVIDKHDPGHYRYFFATENGATVNPGRTDVHLDYLDDIMEKRDAAPSTVRIPTDTPAGE